jgi:hypothetical protein
LGEEVFPVAKLRILPRRTKNFPVIFFEHGSHGWDGSNTDKANKKSVRIRRIRVIRVQKLLIWMFVYTKKLKSQKAEEARIQRLNEMAQLAPEIWKNALSGRCRIRCCIAQESNFEAANAALFTPSVRTQSVTFPAKSGAG